jgi:hypothetical protein
MPWSCPLEGRSSASQLSHSYSSQARLSVLGGVDGEKSDRGGCPPPSHEDNLDSNLSLLQSPSCLLALCLVDPADRTHSPDVAILLVGLAIYLADLIRELGFS